jgi:2-(1,2-epoxy-1,2-dihydrophenyl)acetyl-CoA isomerase
MSDNAAPLLVGREGAVATISFNRPAALNAIDVPMAEAFLAATQDIARDTDIRAVLMRGEGRGFMAGGDLSLLSARPREGAAALIGPMHEGIRLLAGINAPVIAQVHGFAAGAGFSLMMHADFVFAAQNAKFSFAYSSIGTSCDLGASWMLPRRVGMRRALEIAMLGETLDAASAEQAGLVNRVLPPESLANEAMLLAQRLAAGPTVAFGQLRRLLRDSLTCDLATQLNAEAAAFLTCAESTDFRTGIDAFIAREKPTFTGE